MNQIEIFKTFANTPQSNPQQQSYHTFRNSSKHKIEHHSQTPNSHSYQQAKQSRHQTSDSTLSLMHSHISLNAIHSFFDLPFSFLDNAEIGITEELLSLKEDKLTLMEHYNNTAESRMALEREIKKIEKRVEETRRDSSNDTGDLFSEKVSSNSKGLLSESNPIIMKNHILKTKYNELKNERKKESDDSIRREIEENNISQIQELQEKSQQIQDELQEINQKVIEVNQKRFETFFPNQDERPMPLQTLKRKLSQLRNEKHQVLVSFSRHQREEFQQSLMEALNQNASLQEKIKALRERSIMSCLKLRNVIAEEEKSKEVFLKELKVFKEQFERVRRDNFDLKMMK